jgi:hypothetical protein
MTTSPNRWRNETAEAGHPKGERAFRQTERFIECGEEASHVFRCMCGSHLPHPTFASVLPPGRTRMIASADLDGDKEEATGQSLRVVVIDDEPVIAHTLGMILRRRDTTRCRIPTL